MLDNVGVCQAENLMLLSPNVSVSQPKMQSVQIGYLVRAEGLDTYY